MDPMRELRLVTLVFEGLDLDGKRFFRQALEDIFKMAPEQNLYSSTVVVNWKNATEQQRVLLTDAQTSGGLLLCVPGKNLAKVSRLLRKANTPCAVVIGRMVGSRRGPLICMTK